jgi:hypothetical protein
MNSIKVWLGGGLAAALACASLASPAHAMSTKECSAKYQDAKKNGTLGGVDWKTFRATQCASGATTSGATSSAPPAAPASKTTATTAPATPAGPAVFPSAIDPKYSKESPGKARMHTCRDQYQANKAGAGNGGLRWIQKGGGYYSQCTKRLKG